MDLDLEKRPLFPGTLHLEAIAGKETIKCSENDSSEVNLAEFAFNLATDTNFKANDRVKISGSDIDGVPRGKIVHPSKFAKIAKDGFGFCGVTFAWDIVDTTYDYNIMKKHAPKSAEMQEEGFGDLLAVVDLTSYRRIPFEKSIPHFLVDFFDPKTKKPFVGCPRSLLKAQLGKAKEFGFDVLMGMEFEWFNFKETPESLANKDGVNLTPLTPGMFGYSLYRPESNKEFFDGVYENCKDYRIPLESFHTETGPGVLEAAICYAPALEMADRAHLFKHTVKTVGLKNGVMSSFMAKPWGDKPGCSGHIHVSLFDIANNCNAFAIADNDENKDINKILTDVGKQFLAGILAGLADVTPMFLPTVNSYKRLVESYWAPVSISWGVDSRLTSVRIIPAGNASRLEIRIPGADANPYLAMAAIIGLGMYGVTNKLKLTIPEGPTNDSRIPRNLYDATVNMSRKESIGRKIFGDGFIDHFTATRFHEWKQWETSVTNWEIKRYMELV